MIRILIVDDNSQNREILALVFDDARYTTKQLSSPADINVVIGEFSPHIILMDVMTGKFNGI